MIYVHLKKHQYLYRTIGFIQKELFSGYYYNGITTVEIFRESGGNA